MAPELEGSLEFIKYVDSEGIQISIGHSAAEFEDIRDLTDFGLGGFTHTFSGMRGFHHYIRKCTFEPDGDLVELLYDDGRVERINKYDYEKVKKLELSFIDSVKNVIDNVGASVSDVVKMTSENPAKYIGVFDTKGSIEEGKDADLPVIDDKWNIYDVFVQGIKQEL